MTTRHLSESEIRAWRTFLHVSSHLFDLLDQELREAHGYRLADFDILSNLAEATGRKLRMSDLAAETLFSRSRLTYSVKRLEEQGLVKRVPSDEDGRGIEAKLTQSGTELHRRLAATHLRGIRRHFLDHLSPGDQHQLHHTLRPLLVALGVSPKPPL